MIRRIALLLAAVMAFWAATQAAPATAQPASSRPLVGIMDGLGLLVVNSAQPQQWRIVDLLEAGYEIMQAPLDLVVIPDAFDVIVVVHPFALSAPTLFALDQYALRGGRLLVFVDPQAEHSLVSPDNPNALANPASYLSPLLAAWGVAMTEGRVVGDPAIAVPVRVGAGAPQRTEAYLPWIALTTAAGTFNPDDPATAGLGGMMMQSPGALAPIAGAATTFVSLLSTTDTGGTVSLQSAMARNPLQVRLNFYAAGRQVMAARITGPIATAFPDGAPAGAVGGETFLAAAEAVNIIVVADTDLLANELVTYTGLPDNAAFVLAALASLVAAP